MKNLEQLFLLMNTEKIIVSKTKNDFRIENNICFLILNKKLKRILICVKQHSIFEKTFYWHIGQNKCKKHIAIFSN